MNFSERVLSLTQDKLVPKVVDSILNSQVLPLRLIGNADEWKGDSLKKAIKYKVSGLGGSFSGLDTFSTSTSETTARISFDVRGFEQPVAIPGMERAVNAVSETQVTDLVTFKLEEAQQEAIDSIGSLIYLDGTGNSNKDFLGLGAIVDDGTDVGTYGGQLRSAYPVLKAIKTASGGTMDLTKLATLFSNVSSGSERPTIIVSNDTVWNLYESLLTPTVREQYTMFGYPEVTRTSRGAIRPDKGLVGTMGYVALTYKGVAWVACPKATTQTVFMLNEKWLKWFGLDAKGVAGYTKVNLGSTTIEGVYEQPPMSEFHGFNWSGLHVPINQFGEVGHMILLGNLISWQPRRHGKLTGVIGV